MIPAWFKHNMSLKAQIRDTERRVLQREALVRLGKIKLIGNLHRQITSTASLMLAGGIGFMTGELSKCPKRRSSASAVNAPSTEKTPLRNAITLILMARTFYTSFPVTWLIKRFKQSEISARQPD
jgi:hypothetical protein